MIKKDLILLAGASILLYHFVNHGNKNSIGGLENMSELLDLSNKADSNEKVVVGLGLPTKFEILKILDLYKIDVSDFTHTVDNYAVKHALNKHSKDTFPITKWELALIPFITKNPDSIKKGKDKNTNSKRVQYIKKFKNDTFIIEYILEIRTGRKHLAMVTMYKKPAK